MPWQQIYVNEKLREFEQDRRLTPQPPRHSRKPVVGPLARRAGRALRRVGEGLESWGGTAPGEQARQANYR